ncbi:MAG: Nif3-like dinuclear metal center hexameric protein [Puia sp.]
MSAISFTTWRTIAPGRYQEEYDNSGLIAGDVTTECSGVLVSLDCTEEIVKEASEKKCNLIVSHHPLIFSSNTKYSSGK